jgi:hypothetical protein
LAALLASHLLEQHANWLARNALLFAVACLLHELSCCFCCRCCWPHSQLLVKWWSDYPANLLEQRVVAPMQSYLTKELMATKKLTIGVMNAIKVGSLCTHTDTHARTHTHTHTGGRGRRLQASS